MLTAAPKDHTIPHALVARRAIITGLAMAPITAAVTAAAQTRHPDHDLLEAGRRYDAAVESTKATGAALSEAHEAIHKEAGKCPPILFLDDDEKSWVARPESRRFVPKLRLRWVDRVDPDTGKETSFQAWTASALRQCLPHAVPMFGPAGTTPRRIARWRAILPEAEAYDSAVAAAEARHRIGEMREADRRARRERDEAERAILRQTATTIIGLAVITRHVLSHDFSRMPPSWTALLLSAAKISGVALSRPAFDAARWVEEFEGLGGHVYRPEVHGTSGLGWPVRHDDPPEVREALSRLHQEQEENHLAIRLFIERGVTA
ncbi:hypothetical protein [Methylobacterium nodulans]|nr:hypothetical protein [Methylobacterium nodulans]